MNKTYCSKCGKEIEYKGFCCPTMCKECDDKWTSERIFTVKVPTHEEIYSEHPEYTKCLICDEPILLEYREYANKWFYKVCDKCKQAVITKREQIEEYERTGGVCLD